MVFIVLRSKLIIWGVNICCCLLCLNLILNLKVLRLNVFKFFSNVFIVFVGVGVFLLKLFVINL